jgi:hypothetical protein
MTLWRAAGILFSLAILVCGIEFAYLSLKEHARRGRPLTMTTSPGHGVKVGDEIDVDGKRRKVLAVSANSITVR